MTKPYFVMALHGFPSLIDFYRCFVRNYTKLKLHLTNLHALVLLNFSKPFVIEIYVSSVAVGVLLGQEGYPLAFTKKMCPLQNSSIYMWEMFVIAKIIEKGDNIY